MGIDVYEMTVVLFTRHLGNLSAQLEKAEALATARKYDSSAFLQTRLAPDMFPLVMQIQIACDSAKLCCSRLSGVEAPKFEDSETTLAQAKERIAKTVAFLREIPRAKLDGAESREVTFTLRRQPTKATGQTYLLGHGLPTFFFHYTTAYALLRHGGVEIGKADYLGDFMAK